VDVQRLAREVDRELRGLGTVDRAERDQAYLKS
jgi:hypothetical protein